MAVTLNIDSFLPISWSTDYCNRAFQFDAFISHNRGDRYSKGLAQELSSRGATVWHDDNQDVRNRQVQEAVGAALFRSRFVVVSIDDRFQDSPWCRAEYLPALEVARYSAAKRVMVAQMDTRSVVPHDLAGTPCFECWRKDELNRLSSDVQNGNRVSFDTDFGDDTLMRVTPSNDLQSLRQMIRAIRRTVREKNDPNSTALRGVIKAVEDGDHPDPPQYLMAVRQTLIEQADISAFSERDLAFLASAALFFCNLSNPDNRANGMYMLLHLAENDPTGSLRDDVVRIFRKEPDNSLMNLAFPWLVRNWGSLTARQRTFAELCTLRDPTHLRLYYPLSPMVEALSEVARVKIFNCGLESKILSYQERMHLLKERADYILGFGGPTTEKSEIHCLLAVAGVTDLEILFRELDALLFEYNRLRDRRLEGIAVQVVSLIDGICSFSALHKGMPLIAMEERVLDYVLQPLLWCTTVPGAKNSAEKTFGAICDLLEANGALAFAVPLYRDYLATALSGADISQGLFSECFQEVRLSLMEATAENGIKQILKENGIE